MLWETFHNVFLRQSDYQTQCIIFSFLREIRIRILLGRATHFPAGAQSLHFLLYPDYDSRLCPEDHRKSILPAPFQGHSGKGRERLAVSQIQPACSSLSSLALQAEWLRSPAGHLQWLFWEVALLPGPWLQAGSLP